jgi:hypothetical protein
MISEYLLRPLRTLAEVIEDPNASRGVRLNAWLEQCARLERLPDHWVIPRETFDVHSHHSERVWIDSCERANRPADLTG